MKRRTDINAILKPLAEKPYQCYLTDVLQVADVLDWVLAQVGPSKVWQTSFSISEEFLRRLYFLQKKGNITEFNLILDLKATNKTVNLWVYISQVITNTYLANNHSKVLLIEAENGERVCVVTSQNLTRGNRNESAVVCADPEMFTTLYASMQDIVRNHSVPMSSYIGSV
ncbi:MAG: C4-dicarboxylate ABC transporter [Bacteroidaceae bacterium]|nr:C4-dicarboxylate ABC transporter [Bacteroidaceae bacterium]